jgi:ABC-2 type transport system permease protein
MLRLLTIEWKKLWPYRAFRVLFFAFFLLLVLSTLIGRSLRGDSGEEINQLFRILDLPNIWNYYLFIATLLNIVLGIIVIFVVTNEFNYKTVRQNLIDSLTREEIFISKLFLVLILTVLSTIVVFLSGVAAGFIYNPGSALPDVLERSGLTLGYFVACLGTLSMALTIGVLLKRSGLATILFILFIFPIDVILNQGILKGCCADYMPVSVLFKGIIHFPIRMIQSFGEEAQTAVELLPLVMGVIYIIVFNGCTYLLLKKRDL